MAHTDRSRLANRVVGWTGLVLLRAALVGVVDGRDMAGNAREVRS